MANTDLRIAAYVVTYVTFAFGLAANILRLYARGFVQKTWGLDDYFAVGVVLVNIGQLVILQMLLNIDCGLPMAILCSFEAQPLYKIALLEEIILYTVHVIVKMTFLTFFLRLSPKPSFKKAVYVGIGLNVIIYLFSMLLTLLQCTPFEAIAEPFLYPDAQCLDQFIVMITPPVLNIAMDIYILALPIPTILGLNMSLRRRLGVLAVIGSGVCSFVVSCIRIPVVLSLTKSPDTSYELGKMIIVVALEVQFAIIAVNMPSFTALVSRRRRAKTSSNRGKGLQHLGELGTPLSYKASGLGNNRYKKQGVTPGTVTRLERDISGTESREELCTDR